MEGAVAPRKRSELLRILEAAGIPASPVNTVGEYVSEPSLVAAGVLQRAQLGDSQQMLVPGVLFGGLPTVTRTHAPALGEHTREILNGLGIGDDELDRLRHLGAIR